MGFADSNPPEMSQRCDKTVSCNKIQLEKKRLENGQKIQKLIF
jgi:hypothetical protein